MKNFPFKLKAKLKSKKVEDISNAVQKESHLFEKRREIHDEIVSQGNNTSFSSSREKKKDFLKTKTTAISETTAVVRDDVETSFQSKNLGGTSFASSSSSTSDQHDQSAVDSSLDNDLKFHNQSRKSSLTSFSLKSSRSSSMSSLAVNSDSLQQISDLSSNNVKQSLSLGRNEKKNSRSGIWKKLPFSAKVHPIKKQTSMPSPLSPNNHGEEHQLRLHSKSSGDLVQAQKTLEKIQEINSALEIEVRGKDEEVRILSATLDQVNQTWENKVHGVIKDLENAQRQNTQLRTMLAKETAVAKERSNKSAVKIQTEESSRSQPSEGVDRVSKRRVSDAESFFSSTTASSPKEKKGNRNKFKPSTRPLVKTDDVKQHLLEALMSSKSLSKLSSDNLESIVNEMICKRINKGERLMTEGLMGNRFYVLADGECCLYKQSQEESAGLSFAGRTIQKWEIFGESDVFYNAKRVWSCKCTRHGVVWYITKNDFKSTIMQQDIIRRRKEIFNVLRQVEQFQTLGLQHLKEMAKVSKIVFFVNGDYIIRQGLRSNNVFVLKEGEVTTTKMNEGTESRRSKFSPGKLFGDPFSWEPHDENVIASGIKEVVQCVVISKNYLDRVKSHVTTSNDVITLTQVEADLVSHDHDRTDGLQSTSSGSTSSGYFSDLRTLSEKEANQHKRKYNPSYAIGYLEISKQLQDKSVADFNFVSTIGRGAYGKVVLSTLKNKDDQVFAIKKLSKQEVVAAENQQNVFNEKNLQMETSRCCPFIASLYTTLKDQRFVYFVMEYCPGGELFSLLSQAKHFHDNMARFYTGCVVEALSYLHSRHIIFRDLKPENVVFDKDGYCKLTDFGFAKKVSYNSMMRTYTFCGTAEYMAPETILYQAQTFSVDLWSLGVFIFELLNGATPFKNKNRDNLSTIILRGIDSRLEAVKNSRRIGPAASSLIKALCHLRPEDRLGSGKNGISDVTKHIWFHKLNWIALKKRTLKPPWTPKLNSLQDTNYFFVTDRRAQQLGDAEEEFSGWDENF